MKQIEYLYDQLNFEKSVESKIISSNWYLTELMNLAESTMFAECLNELIPLCVNRFENWISVCDKKNRVWLSAALQSRELEYWDKVKFHFEIFEKTWIDILKNIHLKGLQWPTIDMASLKIIIAKRQNILLGKISKQLGPLSLQQRPDDFPDYAGQFLHITAHSIIKAICEPDEILLSASYRHFFYASIYKFQELRPKVNPDDWRFGSQFNIAAAPILDLLEISGYSRLMSAFYNKQDIWKIVTDTWDKFLSNKDTPIDELNLFALCVNITDSEFGIPYRTITRTEWKQKISKLLNSLPKKNSCNKYDSRIPFEEVEHNDPIVRIFARDNLGSFYDGIDIFISEYINKRENNKNIKFGRRREELPDQIMHELKKDNEVIPSNKSDT